VSSVSISPIWAHKAKGSFPASLEDYERAISLFPEQEKEQIKSTYLALPMAAQIKLLLEF